MEIMNKMHQFRNVLRNELKKDAEACPNRKPSHNRFEMENTVTRQCVTVVHKGDWIYLYDTTEEARLIANAGPGEYPHGSTAEECYQICYNKAMAGEQNFVFIGYVDEKFQPLEG
jgi:hypothetical protein